MIKFVKCHIYILNILSILICFNCQKDNNTEKYDYVNKIGLPHILYYHLKNLEKRYVNLNDLGYGFLFMLEDNEKNLNVYILKFKEKGYDIAEIHKKIKYNGEFRIENKKIKVKGSKFYEIYQKYKPDEMCSIEPSCGFFGKDNYYECFIVHIVAERVNYFSISSFNLNKLDPSSRLAKEPQVIFVKTMIDFFNNLDKNNLSEFDSSYDTGKATFTEKLDSVNTWYNSIDTETDN